MAKKLLIDPTEEIKVKFILAERKNGDILGDINEEGLRKAFGDELVEGSVEEHWATFRRPTFGDTVDINGQINTPDGVRLEFNPIAVRFQRMARLLKSWSLMDGDKPIPATASSLSQLDPFVANIIGMQLDAAIGF